MLSQQSVKAARAAVALAIAGAAPLVAGMVDPSIAAMIPLPAWSSAAMLLIATVLAGVAWRTRAC